MDQLFKQRQARLLDFKNLRQKRVVTPKASVPDALYTKCDGCEQPLLSADLKANHYVCPRCNKHLQMRAYERLQKVCDKRSFVEMFKGLAHGTHDFPGYKDKIQHLKNQTGLDEAIICGTATINQQPCAIAVMDTTFLMGSMGSIVGEKLTLLIEHATKKRLPLIVFSASGGARMQEGITSLMQMAKTSAALKRYSEKGGFYVSVLTNPTYGGVSASYAMLGDIILAEPQALVGFAGKRVIAQTIQETLPEGFQTSEYLLKAGFIDEIVERKNVRDTLGFLLKVHAR